MYIDVNEKKMNSPNLSVKYKVVKFIALKNFYCLAYFNTMQHWWVSSCSDIDHVTRQKWDQEYITKQIV